MACKVMVTGGYNLTIWWIIKIDIKTNTKVIGIKLDIWEYSDLYIFEVLKFHKKLHDI